MKIPFAPKSAGAQSLNRCVKAVAAQTNKHPEEVALLLTYFFEELACEVARGRMVTIPGFGAFGSYLHKPRNGDVPFGQPTFSACRPFRNEVRFGSAGAGASVTHAKMRNHRRNHHTSSRSTTEVSRTFTTMQTARKHFKATLRQLHVDYYEPPPRC